MTTLRTACASLALAALTGLGLTACGSDTGSGGSGSDVEEVSTELTEDNLLEEIAAAQAEAGSGHVSLEASESSGGIAGEADFVLGSDDDGTALRLVVDLGDGDEAEVRVVDDALYVSLGETTDDKFLEISDDEDGAASFLGQLASISEGFDPDEQLEQIQDTVTSIEQKGDAETIDGVEATPWVITLDATELLAKAAEDAGLDPEDIPEDALDTVTYTVFVGPDALPRRYVTDTEGVGFSVDLSQWGEDVTVEKPSADEITDEDPFADLGS